MGRLIVIQLITLDAVPEDPDGADHTSFGGWAVRHGPQCVAGVKFRLGPILEHGTLLFGRRTWETFSTLGRRNHLGRSGRQRGTTRRQGCRANSR